MKETLAFQIAALHRNFLTYTTEILKEYDLNFGQIPFIVYVGKEPNTTQAALTRGLRLDWGYSQRSIAKLVELGLMQKELCAQTGCNCLNLTEKGRKVFTVCHEVFRSWDQKLTKTLTEEEKETLILLLRKMTGAEKES